MAMNTINQWDAALTVLVDNTTTAGYTYVGEAPAKANSAVGRAASIWRISRISSTGSTEWASATFNQIWDNRASLSYS